jgi:hypothetical protein
MESEEREDSLRRAREPVTVGSMIGTAMEQPGWIYFGKWLWSKRPQWMRRG